MLAIDSPMRTGEIADILLYLPLVFRRQNFLSSYWQTPESAHFWSYTARAARILRRPSWTARGTRPCRPTNQTVSGPTVAGPIGRFGVAQLAWQESAGVLGVAVDARLAGVRRVQPGVVGWASVGGARPMLTCRAVANRSVWHRSRCRDGRSRNTSRQPCMHALERCP